jgi:hypothetical protein
LHAEDLILHPATPLLPFVSRTAETSGTITQRGGPAAADWHGCSQTARAITEQLITDVGYDPVLLGELDKARAVADLSWLLFAAMKDGAPIFYRFAIPGEL